MRASNWVMQYFVSLIIVRLLFCEKRGVIMFIKTALTIIFTMLVLSISLPASAAKQIGERCLRDGECESGECKKFQCTVRIKPKAQIGERCVVDGDCASDECKQLQCVPNEYKQDK
jgi:hypothetical protein